MRPKGVADGKQVNNPAPAYMRLTDEVTEKARLSGCWNTRFKEVGSQYRQIRTDNSEI